MLSKLRFSMIRNTTCLIGVRVWNALASTAAGSGAETGSGGASSCWPVSGSTVARDPDPPGALADALGEPLWPALEPALQANATAPKTRAAASKRVRRWRGPAIVGRLPAEHRVQSGFQRRE